MQAESLKQRIQRLNDEMAKGTKVYSREELTKLKSMLDDALQTLQLLEDESKPTLGM
jgi:BMFP domain-containing protein YqiC